KDEFEQLCEKELLDEWGGIEEKTIERDEHSEVDEEGCAKQMERREQREQADEMDELELFGESSDEEPCCPLPIPVAAPPPPRSRPAQPHPAACGTHEPTRWSASTHCEPPLTPKSEANGRQNQSSHHTARIKPASKEGANEGSKPLSSSAPLREHRPTDKEKHTGILLQRRTLSQFALDEMIEKSQCRLLPLGLAKAHAAAPGHWATIGVVSSYIRGTTRDASKGKYHKWEITDLHPQHPANLAILWFGDGQNDVCVGQLRVVMSPKLLKGEGSSTSALACTIGSIDQFLLVGQADRVSACRYIGSDSVRCTSLVQRAFTDYCPIHLQLAKRAPPTARLDLAGSVPELRGEFLKRQQSVGARNLVQYASDLHKQVRQTPPAALAFRSAETYDKSDAMSDEEDLVILGAETDIGLKSQEMKRQQRELNNWKKVLYAGKHAVASEGSAGALSAPPADVVAKVFGTVQSKEEKEKLLCHVQLVKQGLAFGQTCGPGS
ncbi:MAG: hypothetical protein SGPRY_005505, partial [Prymnesium sp.]